MVHAGRFHSKSYPVWPTFVSPDLNTALTTKPQADWVSNVAWAKEGQALLYVVTDQNKKPYSTPLYSSGPRKWEVSLRWMTNTRGGKLDLSDGLECMLIRTVGIEDTGEVLEKQLPCELSNFTLESYKARNVAQTLKSCGDTFSVLFQSGFFPDMLYDTICNHHLLEVNDRKNHTQEDQDALIEDLVLLQILLSRSKTY
ncbi:hypothetical protein L1987_33817 [Smallanthus sonchifolius]|uniref:Uncharacterized protein n=1 Tax=Smallanthus sonchifolius TaxID=185202 RepID=A0ACB9HS36_9ASTR|nr:hypothetical protein L1987_33817 [Smallanthus sonchifolius]